MQQNILLTGSDDLLAASIAALELGHDSAPSIYRVQPADERRTAHFLQFVTQEFARVGPQKNVESIQQEISSRLLFIDGGAKMIAPQLPRDFQSGKVWHFIPSQRNFTARDGDPFMRFLTTLPSLGTRELNLVITAYSTDGRTDDGCFRISETAVAEQCRALNIALRIFRCSLVVGTSPILRHDHDFLHFLDTLYRLKLEIQDRVPEYFAYEPLRYLAPPDAEINLIRAEHATQLITAISWQEDTLNHSYDIANPENVPFTDICERIESVYNLSLQVTEDRQELTAIDLLFQELTERFHQHLESPQCFSWEEAHKAAGWNRETVLLDTRAQIALLDGIYKQQDAARSARAERIAALSLQPRRNIDKSGYSLPYFAAGENGTPVVILNALGQGLFYWYPLIDILMQKHRVLIWEPRGTV